MLPHTIVLYNSDSSSVAAKINLEQKQCLDDEFSIWTQLRLGAINN